MQNINSSFNPSFDSIVTANAQMLAIIDQCKKIGGSCQRCLILGELGSGRKTLVHCIHKYSNHQSQGELLHISCSQMNPAQVLAELLGTQGATGSKTGLLQTAKGGTLVIEDADLLPEQDQKRLASIIAQGKFTAMNASEAEKLDCGIVISLEKSFTKPNADDRLVLELWQLFSSNVIHLLSLRERKEDIALLIQYYITEFNQQFKKNVECVSNVALSYLLNYEWPGNIQELKNIIKSAVALADKKVLWLEDIPLKISLTNETLLNEQDSSTLSLKYAEKKHIINVLHVCHWNKSRAAQCLEISRPRLDRKIKEFRLKKPRK